jgi:hypothetical protein
MLLTGLAACGGDDSPPPKAGPSRTATTPSATPSPTPPTLPAAAKANTKAGAKAFVRHYVDLINYAQSTGDLRPLESVEMPTCKSCQSVARYSNSIYVGGGKIVGGDWRESIFAVNPDRVHHRWVIDAVVKFGPQTVTHPSGKKQHLKGGSVPMTFFVQKTGRGWQLAEWTRGR